MLGPFTTNKSIAIFFLTIFLFCFHYNRYAIVDPILPPRPR